MGRLTGVTMNVVLYGDLSSHVVHTQLYITLSSLFHPQPY
jgi:hypothetical protein